MLESVRLDLDYGETCTFHLKHGQVRISANLCLSYSGQKRQLVALVGPLAGTYEWYFDNVFTTAIPTLATMVPIHDAKLVPTKCTARASFVCNPTGDSVHSLSKCRNEKGKTPCG